KRSAYSGLHSDHPPLSFCSQGPQNLFFREILRVAAAQKQNSQPLPPPWLPTCAGMTIPTLPGIPGEHRETRNPSVCSWLPACANWLIGSNPVVRIASRTPRRFPWRSAWLCPQPCCCRSPPRTLSSQGCCGGVHHGGRLDRAEADQGDAGPGVVVGAVVAPSLAAVTDSPPRAHRPRRHENRNKHHPPHRPTN